METVYTEQQFNRQKNIDNCIRTKRITCDLAKWAKRIEKINRVILVLILVSGISISIERAVMANNFFFLPLISGVICTCLFAFVGYGVFKAISLLLDAFTTLTQHTRSTARLLEFMARERYDQSLIFRPNQDTPDYEEM